MSQGQGHQTTFAQIVAQELGIPPEDIEVIQGDTDNTPFGLGTYGSRSTPVSGGAAAIVARVRDKARIVAAAALECSPDDLEWELGRWQVKGDPEKGKTIQEIAMLVAQFARASRRRRRPPRWACVYDPPNLTYPFGAYICVTDVDPGTGQVKVRRFIAVDDCGPRINPMIVEGQVHGGLADGIGMALMQVIAFDEEGNCLGGSFMDYLLPTSMECPSWELGETNTPSPHHPLGVKGVGESATVGSPPAVVNSVLDALRVRHADMPLTPAQVWRAMQGNPFRTDLLRSTRRRSSSRCLSSCSRFDRGTRSYVTRGSAGYDYVLVPRTCTPVSWWPRSRPAPSPAPRRSCSPTGRIEGFVGGACARVDGSSAGTGTARFRRDAAAAHHARPEEPRPGSLTVHNPCLSGGTLEIFLEPVIPAPLVVVAGDTPIARALLDAGRSAWPRRLGVRRRAAQSMLARRRRRVARPRRGGECSSRRCGPTFPYVGLVASRKRGEAVLGSLDVCASTEGAGCTPRPGSTSAPRTPEEVALSILAEIISDPTAAIGSSRRDDGHADICRFGDRPGVRNECRHRRRLAAPRPRRPSLLVLWHRLPASLRRRPRRPTRREHRPGRPSTTLARKLDHVDYLADQGLATALFCAARLPQPLLLEGEAGVGKTEAAKALAAVLDTPLVRLQCYEGIDAAEALYEWNYPRQLLGDPRSPRRRASRSTERPVQRRSTSIARPLLKAIEHRGPRPVVLLIDEVDRADDEFEAFLFELMAESSVTIPELGTIAAAFPPIVVLTSNRTRDLHDALKRRCLYHWIEYPDVHRATEIVRRRVPSAAPTTSPRTSRRPSPGCAPSTCRSRRVSPRRSTGWRRWSCSASTCSTAPQSSARWAR